ncbi:MAG TPA: FixH family protein [Caulobacteraceae bacterium]|nr:FixH family protein [Caulobacteraceae bacterium]
MTSAATPARAASRLVIRGWHVLVGFVLFFGVVIGVNTLFIVEAYHTFPGETSVTPYEDGLAYNKALAQHRAQEALGWRMTAGLVGGALRVDAFDRAGAPLKGLHISALLQRPATEEGRKVVTFAETSPGVYVGKAGALAGAWDMDVTAHDEAGHMMLAERRLVLP